RATKNCLQRQVAETTPWWPVPRHGDTVISCEWRGIAGISSTGPQLTGETRLSARVVGSRAKFIVTIFIIWFAGFGNRVGPWPNAERLDESETQAAHAEHDRRRNNGGGGRPYDHETGPESLAGPIRHHPHTRPPPRVAEEQQYP